MLRRCADAWRESDQIPRKAVNALVDLQPAAIAAADVYGPVERDRILDRVIRLGDEVRDVVAL
jgi:predicted oxidoreductase